MAEGSLSFVADRILGLLRSEDMKKMVGSLGLEETISELASLLPDAEKKSLDDRRLEDWLVDLGEPLYKADNLLDDLSTAALQRRLMSARQKTANMTKMVCGFLSTSSNLVSSRSTVLNELKEVKSRLDELASFGQTLGLVARGTDDGQFQVLPGVRKSSIPSFIVKEEVYGRDHDREVIVRLLLDQELREDITVLPIVGIGGVGKTMLVRDVFDDGRIRKHFEPVIWVCISDEFNIRKIVEEIVCASTAASVRTRVQDLSTHQLFMFVCDSLYGKRYLIVLDDVWTEDRSKWSELKDFLQVGARGSAIILTSCSKMVASMTSTVPPYVLGVLTEEQSWSLFQRMAFGEQDSQESECSSMDVRVGIGKQIVRRCGGLPLCISAIGGMLSFKKTEAEWQFFYENEFSRAVNLLNYDYDIFSLLKLCYDDLPSPLKLCFACCSLFPKDHEIDVQTLVKLWMALGFIHPPTSNDESLEDVGNGYFINLLRRSFFHQVRMDVRGRVTNCKMHDLMHDLAMDVAREHCLHLNFGMAIDRRVYHVSFGSDLRFAEQFSDLLKGAEKLQSILLPSNSWSTYTGRDADEIVDTLISRCRFLRVLDMHALGIKKVPSSIGRLKHLRYLDLSENEHLTELPDSINELLNLQTLKLSSCFELRKLPRDIGNLINLRHLEIDGCYKLVSLPRGIGQLTNLQTLSVIVLSEDVSARSDELKELKRLKNLREEFEIKNLKHGKDDMAAYLDVIREVRSLSLEWESHVPELDDDGTPLNTELFSLLEELALNGFRGATLFWPSLPSNLVKLSLRRWVKGKNLPPLNQCSVLKVLVLDEITDLEYVESEPVSSQTKIFPALQELWLTELPNLQGWWRSSTSLENQEYLLSFPCLSKLVIEDCPKLASMPLFPTLEEGLVLDSTCWNSFQLTMKHRLATAPAAVDEASSSSNVPSSPLSKLKNLCIVGIAKFDNSKADEIAWDTLQSLNMLKFDSLPELTTLPERLRHASSLKELHVWRSGVTEIPAWIGELKLLEKLVIRVCPKLKALPKIKNWRLKTLEIEGCPTLIRRCEKETGADWKKIKHIPDLRLGR